MNSLTRHQFPGKIALAACIVMLALVTATGAQEPTFRAQSNVVTVPVLVRDEHGQAVYGLHAADFLVQDDGVAQSIQMDEAVESEAISMVVALQTGRRAVREFPRCAGWPRCSTPSSTSPGRKSLSWNSTAPSIWPKTSAMIRSAWTRPSNTSSRAMAAPPFSTR